MLLGSEDGEAVPSDQIIRNIIYCSTQWSLCIRSLFIIFDHFQMDWFRLLSYGLLLS